MCQKKKFPWSRNSFVNKWCWDLFPHVAVWNGTPIFFFYTKNKLKTYNYKTSRGKHRGTTPRHWNRQWLFELDSKSTDNTNKNRQMGSYQSKNLMHRKGNNREKRQQKWGKLVNYAADKIIIFKILNEFKKLNNKTAVHVMKWPKDLETFCKRRSSNGQQTHNKIWLGVTSHQGNANVLHKEVSSFSSWNGYYPKINKNNKCWRGCGENETLMHCWWECKLVQPIWKTVWGFLKTLKITLPYDLAVSLLGVYPKEIK